MNNLAAVLCISANLTRTIKNERPVSIATVLVSAFAPANAEDNHQIFLSRQG
jgi:hypothetical protein